MSADDIARKAINEFAKKLSTYVEGSFDINKVEEAVIDLDRLLQEIRLLQAIKFPHRQTKLVRERSARLTNMNFDE